MHFVGNVMIDTLCWALPQALLLDAPARFDVEGRPYAVVTLHQPANVDDPAVLRELLEALARLADRVPVLFPVHPRTRARILELRRPPTDRGLRLTEPVGYLDMLSLVANASLVVTDSGGLQEETCSSACRASRCGRVRSARSPARTGPIASCSHSATRFSRPPSAP